MSIVIGESYGEYGVIFADTLLTRIGTGTPGKFDPNSHGLKVHLLSRDLCIGIAGASFDVGLETVKRLSSLAKPDTPEKWAELTASAFAEVTAGGPGLK